MAVLHLNSLTTQTSPLDFRRALHKLPDGIDAAYDQTIQRIKERQQWELAELALTWTVLAQRPLHIDEFNHALTIKAGMSIIDPEAVQIGEIFVSECAGLVVVEDGSQLVRLVHVGVIGIA